MTLGTIVSTFDSPSTSKFAFVVNGASVHKGQFVEVESGFGLVVGLVTDLVNSNKYFERPDSVKAFTEAGSLQFPVSDWECLVAEVKPLAVQVEGKLKRPVQTLSPGNTVRTASEETLKNMLGFDFENGLNLGSLEFHDVPVSPSMDKFLRKHLAILSISGGGKSHTTACLLEELLDRTREQGRMGVVVFDAHGEYAHLSQPPKTGKKDYSRKVKVFPAEQVKVACTRLNAGFLERLVPDITSKQKRVLASALSTLKGKRLEGYAPFELKDLRAMIDSYDLKDAEKEGLKYVVDQVESLKLFAAVDYPKFNELSVQGQLSVIDFNGVNNQRVKRVIVAHLGDEFFNARRSNKIPPTLLVLEEAHQFIPQTEKRSTNPAKPVMEKIAREGRKFGVCLCLISQRPVQLSTTALSQCNTKIILRITNPYDIEHISKSSEALDKHSENILSSLRVGDALLVGEAVNFPVFFKVRDRKSEGAEHEKSLDATAREFEAARASLADDASAYV